MLFASIFDYTLWAYLIEFGGGLLIVGYIVAAIIVLLRTGNITQARLLAADGAIMGLSFKLATHSHCTRFDGILLRKVRRLGVHRIAPKEPVVESRLPPKTPDLPGRET
jgi:hypothetical protein